MQVHWLNLGCNKKEKSLKTSPKQTPRLKSIMTKQNPQKFRATRYIRQKNIAQFSWRDKLIQKSELLQEKPNLPTVIFVSDGIPVFPISLLELSTKFRSVERSE